jgi:transposase
VPEVRRLLLTLTEPPEQFSFRLRWSRWRRRHQATAQRCHTARRAKRPVVLLAALPANTPTPAATMATRPRGSPQVTDEQWQRLRPILPPQRPPRGRPNHDHRRMVAAMLWVERTGCSWRALPDHFGPWPGVYSRYQRWRKAGMWTQILAVLDQPDAQLAAA